MSIKQVINRIDQDVAYAFKKINEMDYKKILKSGILLEDLEDKELGTRAYSLRDKERAVYMLNQMKIWMSLVKKYPSLDNDTSEFIKFASWYPEFINSLDRYPNENEGENWYLSSKDKQY
jgi:hypothetical protein